MPLLPSLDQQTRSARESAGVTFMWHHIDTCLPSFLNDHHHRDGELLLGVHVDGSSTVNMVLDGLITEFHQIAYQMGETRRGYDHDAAKAALDRLYTENLDRMDRTFDSSLTPWVDGDENLYDSDEWCQAYFLLTWDVPEEEDDRSD